MDLIRRAFEEICYPNFGISSGHGLRRKPNGEYASDSLEDHWQTFQEGWEAAVDYFKGRKNPSYSDMVSNGGLDPRN